MHYEMQHSAIAWQLCNHMSCITTTRMHLKLLFDLIKNDRLILFEYK